MCTCVTERVLRHSAAFSRRPLLRCEGVESEYFPNDGQNDLEKKILEFLRQCPHGFVKVTLHESGRLGEDSSISRLDWKIPGKQRTEALAEALARYISTEYARGVYKGATVTIFTIPMRHDSGGK